MYEFHYHKALSLKDALSKLDSSEDGKIIAGGMTLLPTMKQRLAAPSDLIDLTGIDALKGIKHTENIITIGAMTTHYDVHSSETIRAHIPALSDLAGLIGDPMVRHRGTIGGSVANSDPSADYPAAILGIGATIITNQRKIDSSEYFKGLFETALEEKEIITSIEFPIPDRAAYTKFPQPASRYALVGVFISKKNQKIRVSVTGAGPCAFRVSEMEKSLEKNFSPDSISEILIESNNLNSDIHGGSEYRAHLVTVLAKRSVEQILNTAQT